MTTSTTTRPGDARPAQRWSANRQREQVDAFVARHFTWPGTLYLHRAALGLDILRAPVNVILSLVLVLTRLTAWLCRRLWLTRAADWLGRRVLLLRTSVSARVEALVLGELLAVPLPERAHGADRETLTRAILAAPQFRDIIRNRGSVAEARVMADRVMRTVVEYTSARSAMAEVITGLITLALGAVLFQALTPGMISMAPGVAEAMSYNTAIANFPLGRGIGGMWYGVFPIGPAPWLVAVTVCVLVLIGSVIAAFAGVIADPLQAWAGLHRRRLMRLFDTLEADILGAGDKPFVAREHYLVRLLDLWDTALSLVRAFRN